MINFIVLFKYSLIVNMNLEYELGQEQQKIGNARKTGKENVFGTLPR